MRPLSFTLVILLATHEAIAACSKFVSTAQRQVLDRSFSSRISTILHCPQQKKTCMQQSDGNSKVHGHLNITGLSEDDIASIYKTIQKSNAHVGRIFEPVACGSIRGYTETIAGGKTGLLTFTPKLVCIKGYLDDCKNGPVRSHTYVHACAPKILAYDEVSGTRNGPDGTISFLYTKQKPDPFNPATKVKCGSA